MLSCRKSWPQSQAWWTLGLALLLLAGTPVFAQIDDNEPGILEPVTSFLQNKEIRVPNTDQSVDGVEQSAAVNGEWELLNALGQQSILGHNITRLASPNNDMRLELQRILQAAQGSDVQGMRDAAEDLKDILLGTTQGRIYDGFAMLNFNRGAFVADHVPGEYKMKIVQDSGDRFISPFDGEERKVWELNVNMLYYDGQIDSDTFLMHFPADVHPDDTVRVHYKVYSMVVEDFSPTLVMLDRRQALNSVNFPFKGFDAVWIAFNPGQILDVTIDYPPARMVRGVYTWGWRVHPPRIQFLQPTYDIINQHTGQPVRDPQSESFIYRNREDLTLESIAPEAPEMKMYTLATAILDDNLSPFDVTRWMLDEEVGPRGTWIDWSDLAFEQRQLPPEAWDLLAEEGLTPGNFGDYNMITVIMNNEAYGQGPNQFEVRNWNQGDHFKVKLINFDKHTHYFRNVDFGTRLHDDILRCCGGGETSFEVMNFKPSYGAPKVAEMQWRAGWGFRPHYDVIQQQGVFSRGSDRVRVKPYTNGGLHIGKDYFFGYQYSEAFRGGDFRFNPPPFIIGVNPINPNSSDDVLRDADGLPGLVIGQHTEGYGVGQFCPGDPYPGFCQTDVAQFNPNGALNFPPPPLRGQPVFPVDVGKFPGDVYPDHAVELRYPPFLRNPDQNGVQAGDIIPPTSAWRPFLWLNPNNGTLFIDPNDKSKGYWSDLTYSHGAPVFAGQQRNANIELPRASGQVFYQFDDLFHDNVIFSPHPLDEGEDEIDVITTLSGIRRGNSLRVQGELSQLSIGEFANWVTLHIGTNEGGNCVGAPVATAKVNQNTGRFVFRVSNEGLPAGDSICVESSVSAVADAITK